MKVRFWGVRGSTPTPFQEHLRYGGNTSCVEVRTANGDLYIFDAGTGLRPLGKQLLRDYGHTSINGFLFLSHYHWDHIQGIPFFEPLYNPENNFYIHSFPCKNQPVEEALQGQMSDPYFPVNMHAMRAHRHFRNLTGEKLTMNDAVVSTARLNHPQGCLGYRVDSGGKAVVYATDNEPGVPEYDRNVRDLAKGADVFIYDSQYTPLEYVNFRKGWGHSTWREGVNIAQESGVKKLVLYHHDPDHNDLFIDSILHEAERYFPGVVAASEGMEIDLAGEQPEVHLNLFNRRNGDRQPIHLPIVVQGRNSQGLSFVEHTVLENLSLGGAFFQLENDPDPRRSLELHIKVSAEPTGKPQVIQAETEIVRAEDPNAERKRGIAVSFRRNPDKKAKPERAHAAK